MLQNTTERENDVRVPSAAKNSALPTAMACAVFAISLIYAIITARSLYADGALYLLKILQTGTFVEFEWNRNNATYLLELPAVIALKLGVVDLRWLTLLFSIGCYCAWPIAMWFCYQMARDRFWLVMLACAAGCLNTSFNAAENLVAHAFFWPALFAILFVRPLTPRAAVYLLLSAAILTRSYESLFF